MATDAALIRLYAEVAALTAPVCDRVASCEPGPNRCCKAFWCQQTIRWAEARWGVALMPTGHPTLPLMGAAGCIAPPHHRPLCALQVCASAREDPDYLALRAAIEAIEDPEGHFDVGHPPKPRP